MDQLLTETWIDLAELRSIPIIDRDLIKPGSITYQLLTGTWIIKALHKVNGPITNRVSITDRDLIGPGPITDRVPSTDRYLE